jgi:hypothetical protein
MNPILATAAVLYLFLVAGVCFILDAFRNKNVPKPTPKPELPGVFPKHTAVLIDGAWQAVPQAQYPETVRIAGGTYVGIQEVEGADNLVLFNSPKTGSTLAVRESDFCYIAVVKRLEAHEAQWSR